MQRSPNRSGTFPRSPSSQSTPRGERGSSRQGTQGAPSQLVPRGNGGGSVSAGSPRSASVTAGGNRRGFSPQKGVGSRQATQSAQAGRGGSSTPSSRSYNGIPSARSRGGASALGGGPNSAVAAAAAAAVTASAPSAATAARSTSFQASQSPGTTLASPHMLRGSSGSMSGSSAPPSPSPKPAVPAPRLPVSNVRFRSGSGSGSFDRGVDASSNNGGDEDELICKEASDASGSNNATGADAFFPNNNLTSPEVDASEQGNTIKVCVRVRPFSPAEIERDEQASVSKLSEDTLEYPSIKAPRGVGDRHSATQCGMVRATYDWVMGSEAQQVDIFDKLGRGVVQSLSDGFHGCVLAYGMTGCGKSHTIFGGRDEARGLLPRLAEGLFDEVRRGGSSDNTLEVSFLEIYNEKVRDLLTTHQPGDDSNASLQVRHHPRLGAFVEGLTHNLASSVEDVVRLLDYGHKIRIVGATNANVASSRSHAIVTLSLKMHFRGGAGVPGGSTRRSHLHVVDLVGCERLTMVGDNESRQKESKQINRSLTALNHMISRLSARACRPAGSPKKNEYIPFRDSKLTHILSHALMGSCKTVVLACISPAESAIAMTESTLRFASSAKKITTQPEKNEDVGGKLVAGLLAEIEVLKKRLEKGDNSTQERLQEELAEQMASAQLLYQELNTTREELQALSAAGGKRRTQVLQNMGLWQAGLGSGNVPNEGLPAREGDADPYLVNICDDPLLSGKLIYILSAAQGPLRLGSDPSCQIHLDGLGILAEMCMLTCTDGKSVKLTLPGSVTDAEEQDTSTEGSSMMHRTVSNGSNIDRRQRHGSLFKGGVALITVNGEAVRCTRTLNHEDRLRLGRSHTFQVFIPRQGKARPQGRVSQFVDIMEFDTMGAKFLAKEYARYLKESIGPAKALQVFKSLGDMQPLVEEANDMTQELRGNEEDELHFQATILQDILSVDTDPEVVITLREIERPDAVDQSGHWEFPSGVPGGQNHLRYTFTAAEFQHCLEVLRDVYQEVEDRDEPWGQPGDLDPWTRLVGTSCLPKLQLSPSPPHPARQRSFSAENNAADVGAHLQEELQAVTRTNLGTGDDMLAHRSVMLPNGTGPGGGSTTFFDDSVKQLFCLEPEPDPGQQRPQQPDPSLEDRPTPRTYADAQAAAKAEAGAAVALADMQAAAVGQAVAAAEAQLASQLAQVGAARDTLLATARSLEQSLGKAQLSARSAASNMSQAVVVQSPRAGSYTPLFPPAIVVSTPAHPVPTRLVNQQPNQQPESESGTPGLAPYASPRSPPFSQRDLGEASVGLGNRPQQAAVRSEIPKQRMAVAVPSLPMRMVHSTPPASLHTSYQSASPPEAAVAAQTTTVATAPIAITRSMQRIGTPRSGPISPLKMPSAVRTDQAHSQTPLSPSSPCVVHQTTPRQVPQVSPRNASPSPRDTAWSVSPTSVCAPAHGSLGRIDVQASPRYANPSIGNTVAGGLAGGGSGGGLLVNRGPVVPPLAMKSASHPVFVPQPAALHEPIAGGGGSGCMTPSGGSALIVGASQPVLTSSLQASRTSSPTPRGCVGDGSGTSPSMSINSASATPQTNSMFHWNQVTPRRAKASFATTFMNGFMPATAAALPTARVVVHHGLASPQAQTARSPTPTSHHIVSPRCASPTPTSGGVAVVPTNDAVGSECRSGHHADASCRSSSSPPQQQLVQGQQAVLTPRVMTRGAASTACSSSAATLRDVGQMQGGRWIVKQVLVWDDGSKSETSSASCAPPSASCAPPSASFAPPPLRGSPRLVT
eukprot:TRINITY_DN29080_c0_g1_i1.p1 TRINITY_DN29080_c0_g1~~TRINITY_DN29080_c0_g1_i1.p1  ORF type:complete len:1778 (+),score=310.46 TRINITY_DN29080_c0_g1_i1:103-5436(+)